MGALAADRGDGGAAPCSNFSKGFLSFLGAGKLTGVYALLLGSILSSSAGFVGMLDGAAGFVTLDIGVVTIGEL